MEIELDDLEMPEFSEKTQTRVHLYIDKDLLAIIDSNAFKMKYKLKSRSHLINILLRGWLEKAEAKRNEA